ncbi:hypothetical protein [Sediminibacterium sp.]|uniref:hypothetical protein n=1 Tax=Sediminibacterium sp. TaxID=1917865 RepID=UPI003F69AF9F
MKNICSLLLFAFCISCSSKEMSFEQTPTGPELGFSDTVYIRERDSLNLNGNGVINIYTKPAEQQLHLQLSDTSGKVHFSYRGEKLNNNQPVVVAGEWNSLFCKVDQAGIYGIEVSLRDQLGRQSFKKLVIKAAAAQRPVAKLLWMADERDSINRRYFFDAHGSSQPYGKIMSYHYEINGQSFQVNTEKMQYQFYQKGSYPVRFFVVDDLSQHSDTLHQVIDVL